MGTAGGGGARGCGVHRTEGEGEGDYVTLCIGPDRVLAERRLDPACLPRIHRAYIVDLDYVFIRQERQAAPLSPLPRRLGGGRQPHRLRSSRGGTLTR